MKTRPATVGDRRDRIGASEVASILGHSPWTSAYTLALEKLGKLPRKEMPELELPRSMEPMILAEYRRRTKRDAGLWDQELTVPHKELPYLCATPDAFSYIGGKFPQAGYDGLIEIKCASGRSGWEDGPPLHYRVQVQVQMMCTELHEAEIAAYFGGKDFEIFPIAFDALLEAQILEAVPKFWALIQAGLTPEPDDSERTLKSLKQAHPANPSRMPVDLAGEALRAAERLVEVRGLQAALEREERALQAQVVLGLDGAPVGRLASGEFRFTQSERKGFFVKPTTVDSLRYYPAVKKEEAKAE